MRRFQLTSLRTVLLALVVVGSLPVSALTIQAYLQDRVLARRQVAAEAARVTRLAVLRQQDLLAGGRDFLAAVTRVESVQALDGPGCSRDLQAMLAPSPRFANVGVADIHGELRCSAVPTTRTLNFADRAWFRRTVATRAFAVGDYQVGRITNKPTLAFGYPVVDDEGHLAGAAFAALDLDWLGRFAADAGIPRGGVLLITDERSDVVARQPDPEHNLAGGGLPSELRAGFQRQLQGTVEAMGADGVRRLYSFRPLGRPLFERAVVVAGIPTSAAYAEANRRLGRSLVGLGGIALLGAGAAWVVGSRRVIRPTRALVVAAERLAAGDGGARVGPRYGLGEVGAVGRAFDDMAAALGVRESELSRSRGQLQAVLDNAPAAVFMKDTESRYLFVNRAFEEIVGVGRGEAIGVRSGDVIPPGERVGELAHDQEVMATRSSSERNLVVAGEGGARTFRSMRFPLCDDSGAVYAIGGVVVEITGELKAKTEREVLEAELDQARRLESIGRLAGGIAHDFNNLLAVILNYGDFVLRGLEGLPGYTGGESLDGIHKDAALVVQAAEKASALTRQLLIFARRDPVQPAVLDLNNVVSDLAPILSRTLGEDVAVELCLQPALWSVQADPGRMGQVLMNLVANARDAMPHGGTLTMRTHNVVVNEEEGHRRGLSPGAHVELTVADTGTGMTPEVQSRALEPFFTTKPTGQGTGLGLAIVFGAVVDAGGRLKVESTPGRGTVMRMFLPADARRPPEPDAPRVPEPAAGRGETVLLVEDEEPVREAARRLLVENGYKVLSAGDGFEALELCATHPMIDLLLTDVVMPGLSGPKLVEQARLVRPGLRAGYISGYPEDHRTRCQMTVEVSAVLAKPFTAKSLLRHVRRALDVTEAT